MKRKNFLLKTIAAVPALTFARIATASPQIDKPFIIRSGNNRSGASMIKFMGLYPNDVVISRKDTNNELSVFLFEGHANASTPLHLHFHQDEFFYVVEGKFLFVCGEMKSELTAGDTIFLPRNIPHQWLQISDSGKLLYAVNPAGTLEDMFKDLDELKTPLNKEIMEKMLAKHGQKLLGPPMMPQNQK